MLPLHFAWEGREHMWTLETSISPLSRTNTLVAPRQVSTRCEESRRKASHPQAIPAALKSLAAWCSQSQLPVADVQHKDG